MLEITPRTEVITNEKIPQPYFHGMLVTPETIGPLPNGKRAVATFNAAVVSIPNPQTGELEHVAVYRVNTSGHVEGHPDQTEFFGFQRFALTNNTLEVEKPTFVDAISLATRR